MECDCGPASDAESGDESCDGGVDDSPPPEKSRRVEREYTPDDVKMALRQILAKLYLHNEKQSAASAARDAGFPSMERHVRRLTPLPPCATHTAHTTPAHARS